MEIHAFLLKMKAVPESEQVLCVFQKRFPLSSDFNKD